MPTLTALMEPTMAKKSCDGAKPGPHQTNIRLEARLYARVKKTAEAFGLDVAPFLKMLVKKHLSTYEAEAEEIRQREQS